VRVDRTARFFVAALFSVGFSWSAVVVARYAADRPVPTSTAQLTSAEVSAAPLVGILGGMGPLATADLYEKIVANTPARTDQEHLRVVVWADPTTPDRTAALEGGPTPVPKLQAGIDQLERAGASFIVVACNTAHAFFPALHTNVPLLSIMDETARAVKKEYPEVKTVGLLATRGTTKAGMYQKAFAALGMEVVAPDEAGQASVSEAIARVKAGDRGAATTALVGKAADDLVAKKHAELLLTGCTELPIVFRASDAHVPVVDPTEAVAKAVVARARAAK
jgi:aspartate racemase